MEKCKACEGKMEYIGYGVYKCTICGETLAVQGQLKRCPRCGSEYYAYTDFDPSVCSKCNKELV